MLDGEPVVFEPLGLSMLFIQLTPDVVSLPDSG
jgi:hypothetical protein